MGFLIFNVSICGISFGDIDIDLISSGRGSPPEVFLGKGVLKICSKFTRKYPCRSVISIKLLCNFIEITLRHGCSPVNLLHIFRTPFSKNASGELLLFIACCIHQPISCKSFYSNLLKNSNFFYIFR